MDNQPNEVYCMCIYSSINLSAEMSSFGTDACVESFAIFIKFMTLMHRCSIRERSGVAWKKVINDAMDEWHRRVRGRVFSPK